MAPRDRPDHHGYVGVVAVADPDRLAMLEIDTVEGLEERRHEMPARLLAVGDDVDPRFDLVAHREADGVFDALGKRVALESPGSPERLRLREPGRLGQTAGDRRLQSLVIESPEGRAWVDEVRDYSRAAGARAETVRPLDQSPPATYRCASSRSRPRAPYLRLASMAKVLFSDHDFRISPRARALRPPASISSPPSARRGRVIAAARLRRHPALICADHRRVVASLPGLRAS
jgi:hypothetical protein